MGKGGGSGGGKPDKSTVSHGNEASGAPAIHASERRWTALSCLTGHDHTFSLWMPSCRAMGYKSKGNGKSWGDGACRRGYGRPERERLHMTSLFLLWLLLRPIPFRVPDSGNIIWHCYYKPAVSCLTALHLGSKNIN